MMAVYFLITTKKIATILGVIVFFKVILLRQPLNGIFLTASVHQCPAMFFCSKATQASLITSIRFELLKSTYEDILRKN